MSWLFRQQKEAEALSSLDLRGPLGDRIDPWDEAVAGRSVPERTEEPLLETEEPLLETSSPPRDRSRAAADAGLVVGVLTAPVV